MKFAKLIVPAVLLAILPAAASFADSFKADGFPYSDVTVLGIADGKLSALVSGNEKLFDLDTVNSINLNGQPKFNEAEKDRKDAKAAAELYTSAIQNIDDPKLKLLAKLRAVGPTDADGKFRDALSDFLDVYAKFPTATIWKLRPTNVPAPPSQMLTQAAADIRAKLPYFNSDEAKKNLKTLELTLLTKANDPGAAALAKELGTGMVETPAPAVKSKGAAAPAPITGGDLQSVVSALHAKAYGQAISQADALLKTATGPTAVELFELKAQALEGLKRYDEASATYLRVVTHYPESPDVIPDIQKAAAIQESLHHTDEAKRLTEEIANIRKRANDQN